MLCAGATGPGRRGGTHPRTTASPAVQVQRTPVLRLPARSRLRPGPRLPGLRRLRRTSLLSGQSGRLLPRQVPAVQHLPGRRSSAVDASVDQRPCRLPAPHFILLTMQLLQRLYPAYQKETPTLPDNFINVLLLSRHDGIKLLLK